MTERQRKRRQKWMVLGVVGMISGIVMLLFFRSVPLASGSAAATILAIIALKHLALFIAVSSPLAAIFQSIKPRLRAFCGRPPEDD
jgi:hypothetical protein